MPAPNHLTAAADYLDTMTSALPSGGEARSGQRAMTAAVEAVIAESGNLFVQAGTGTGKSLAYLVPAVLSDRRVVIATATKALQDQLADKDLPFLREHLGHDFHFAVLKGRSNYVCMQRLAELSALPGAQLGLDGMGALADASQLALLQMWASTTATGDRAELPFEPSSGTWSAVSIGVRECPGATRCPRGKECFAERARDRAAHADVIVVNQHLLALDIALDGAILPEHDLVIIDEAHQFEDIMARAAGMELNGARVHSFERTVRAVLSDTGIRADLERAAGGLTDALAGLKWERLARPLPDELAEALNIARERVDRAANALRNIPDDSTDDVKARKVRAQQASISLLVDIDAALNFDENTAVAWVEGEPASMNICPIDIAQLLATSLWGKRAAILTSATLPPRFPQSLGAPAGGYEELDVGSPFDYEHAALLYCATSLPDPRQPGYRAAMLAEIESLMTSAGGRTLALFTSWRGMQEAADYLRNRVPWRIYTQGELPKPALLRAFTDDESSCLFATMSYWQGVDVPGPSLSLVVIDRIPFPRPDDPLLQARRERIGPDAFAMIDVPRAATMLAQGAGRLIRSATDQGVVAVLDPRLAKNRSYRWAIINALPPMRRTRNREDAEAFLRRIRDR